MDKKTCGLRDSLVNLDYKKVKENVSFALRRGIDPLEIVNSLTDGIRKIGKKYEAGEYFLPEMIMASEIFKEVMGILNPYLKSSKNIQSMGKVVICTVEGDIHNIGKNIVKTMLTSAGFSVIDLGVDVPAKKLVENVKNEKPDIVAMSALLTSTMGKMKEAIDELGKSRLRKDVKVLIGGAPINRGYAKRIGADAYGKDASDAVKKAIKLVKGKR